VSHQVVLYFVEGLFDQVPIVLSGAVDIHQEYSARKRGSIVDDVSHLYIVDPLDIVEVLLPLVVNIVIKFMDSLPQNLENVASDPTRSDVILVVRMVELHTFSDLVDGLSCFITNNNLHLVLHRPHRVHLINVIYPHWSFFHLVGRFMRLLLHPIPLIVVLWSLYLRNFVSVWRLIDTYWIITTLDVERSVTILSNHHIGSVDVV
jgi:hypothetical protein